MRSKIEKIKELLNLPKRVKVNSSAIDEIVYIPTSSSEEDGTLEVIISGRIYNYLDVPEYVYLEFLNSQSKGTYYSRFIKKIYTCKKIA